MKAIVFGGAGFLGSYVADALSEKGYQVGIFDINESVYIKKDQKMIVGNILDHDFVTQAIQGYDYVYNFAGLAGIEEARKEPLKTIQQNVLGNANILEGCRRNAVKRFVYASSIYVYSNMAPFYRSSKQACELIIDDYSKVYNLDYTILRYGSLYGKRANQFNFIRRIIEQAIQDGKITRAGDGEEIRDYIHVLDAAQCSVEILSEEYKNQHVILTGTQSTKVKNLLMMIREIFGHKVEIDYVKGDNGDHYEITPYSFRPKLAKKLVSHNYHDLGQGILDVIYEVYECLGKNKGELAEVQKLLAPESEGE